MMEYFGYILAPVLAGIGTGLGPAGGYGDGAGSERGDSVGVLSVRIAESIGRWINN